MLQVDNSSGGVVSADTFSLSVAGAFDYNTGGVVSADTFSLSELVPLIILMSI